MITKTDILDGRTEIFFTHPCYREKISHYQSDFGEDTYGGLVMGGAKAKQHYIYLYRYPDIQYLIDLVNAGILKGNPHEWVGNVVGYAITDYRSILKKKDDLVKVLNALLDSVPELTITIVVKKTGERKVFKSGLVRVSLEDFFKVK